MPDSKPQGSLRYKETHHLSAAFSPLPASPQSSKIWSALQRWKPELQDPVRVRGLRKGPNLSGKGGRVLQTPLGWDPGQAEGEASSKSRASVRPGPLSLRFLVCAGWIRDPYGQLLPEVKGHHRSLNTTQAWEKVKHFWGCFSESVGSSNQCDRAERFHMNSVKSL